MPDPRPNLREKEDTGDYQILTAVRFEPEGGAFQHVRFPFFIFGMTYPGKIPIQ
jgi:hypothetical protein